MGTNPFGVVAESEFMSEHCFWCESSNNKITHVCHEHLLCKGGSSGCKDLCGFCLECGLPKVICPHLGSPSNLNGGTDNMPKIQLELPTPPMKLGSYGEWGITPVEVQCIINAKISKCGKSMIPAGGIVFNFSKTNTIFWCATCAMQIVGAVPETLHQKIAEMKKHDSIKLISFAFKKGAPEGCTVVDVRKTLRNPWGLPGMKKIDGRHPKVREFVQSCPKWKGVLNTLVHYAKYTGTAAVGCAGGKHRSVAIVEMAAEVLRSEGLTVEVLHRELEG